MALSPIILRGSPIGFLPGKSALARLSVMTHLSGDDRAPSASPATKWYEKMLKKVESARRMGLPSVSSKLSSSDLTAPPWLTTQQVFSISGYILPIFQASSGQDK